VGKELLDLYITKNRKHARQVSSDPSMRKTSLDKVVRSGLAWCHLKYYIQYQADARCEDDFVFESTVQYRAPYLRSYPSPYSTLENICMDAYVNEALEKIYIYIYRFYKLQYCHNLKIQELGFIWSTSIDSRQWQAFWDIINIGHRRSNLK
jgi:hypothetical protein